MTKTYQRLFKFFRISFILILLICLVMEFYCRKPDEFKVRTLSLPSETEMAVLLFHGARDHLNPEVSAIATKFTKLLITRSNTEVINYDWSFAANNRLRASANAIEVGKILGRELAMMDQLKHLRIIAHSGGAFVPDELCRTYRNAGGMAYIEITFLDPFGLRGFLDRGFGVRSHGSCADFALSIVNTDDPAPTTNSILKNAWNLDVTGLPRPTDFIYRKDLRTVDTDFWLGVGETLDDVKRNLNNPEQQHNGHYWPPYYFLTILDEKMAQPAERQHQQFPRGSVIDAPPVLIAE
jgi:hypothetical protein